jgi:hypothetical protein
VTGGQGAAVFLGGLAVGFVVCLQFRENQSSCCRRVGEAVRDEVVGAVGPVGGWLYDVLNLRAIAPAVLDAAKVPP